MCEDKIYLWLKQGTDKDITEKDLKEQLLGNHQIRQTKAQFSVHGDASILKWWANNSGNVTIWNE